MIIVVVLIFFDIGLFAAVIIKRLLRNASIRRFKYLTEYYDELIGVNLKEGRSFWDNLSKKSAIDDRRYIVVALSERFKTATAGEQELIRDLFADAGYLDHYLDDMADSRSLVKAQAIETLGDFRIRDAAAPTISALSDQDMIVRSAAVRALGRIGSDKSIKALVEALRTTDMWSPARIVDVINTTGKKATPYLIPLMESGDEKIKPLVAYALGEIGDQRGVSVLTGALRSENIDLRAKSAEALGKIGDRSSLFQLRALLADPAWPVRAMAAKALGSIKYSGSISGLLRALSDPNWWVRSRASESLINFGPEGEAALIKALGMNDRFAKEKAADTLQTAGVIERYLKEITSPDPSKANEAIKVLAALQRSGAVSPFNEALARTDDPLIRKTLGDILTRMKKEA